VILTLCDFVPVLNTQSSEPFNDRKSQ